MLRGERRTVSRSEGGTRGTLRERPEKGVDRVMEQKEETQSENRVRLRPPLPTKKAAVGFQHLVLGTETTLKSSCCSL